ncbi:cytochrome d ubiquinol oxidase subunit II [Methyloraptor flagellatus]|uniref:Cytochrome d ubiquinol oxidase subunit II n=1 Tax=Methyloraptor flagellatus TaxID=3162530 RepID=A0AAU7XDR1_9HYPH
MSATADLLPVVWAVIIAVAVVLYVIMDGFDLGIGILFPGLRDEGERDQAMNSIAPYWDGNETWLVLGGGGLWVAFPKAYAVVMPALYIPVIAMLLALIFRGVAFEFRFAAKPNHRAWDLAFMLGSMAAAFFQGCVLGGLLSGIKVENGAFAGGPLDWLTPFSVLCGLGLMAGYALLGAGWLVLRTHGDITEKARRLIGPLAIAVGGFVAAVSLWTPIHSPAIAARWFSFPNIALLWPLPALTAAFLYWVWRHARNGNDTLPFPVTIGVFVLAFAGLGISVFPMIVPPSMTVWDAAAAPESLVFFLIGTLVMIPVVLGYTAFVYWTFRGRIGAGEGYH